MQQYATETIDRLLEEIDLLEEIEQAEAEIQEQEDLIIKFKLDEEQEDVNNSGNLKKARLQLKEMQRNLNELRRKLEEIESFDNLATIIQSDTPKGHDYERH